MYDILGSQVTGSHIPCKDEVCNILEMVQDRDIDG